jgi:hypothetical protein
VENADELLESSRRRQKANGLGLGKIRGPAHPRFLHGLYKREEHRIWTYAKQRCFNESHESYGSYGGRGIFMCWAWIASFPLFFAYLGPRPSRRHTVDRIDNDRGYEPGNVRWALPEIQQRNKRTTKLTVENVAKIRTLTNSGQMSCADAAAAFGISKSYAENIRSGADVNRVRRRPSAV